MYGSDIVTGSNSVEYVKTGESAFKHISNRRGFWSRKMREIGKKFAKSENQSKLCVIFGDFLPAMLAFGRKSAICVNQMRRC